MKRINVMFISAIVILLLLLLYTVSDSNRKIDILVKNHQKQLTKIEQLQAENERLESAIIFQHQQIKELRSKSVAVVKPIAIHKKEKIHNKETDIEELINHPTTIMATLLTMGKMISSFVPSFSN